MSAPDPDMFTAPNSLTKNYYRDIYPAVDPTNPELSASGKVVVITGAAGGIGFVGLSLEQATSKAGNRTEKE